MTLINTIQTNIRDQITTNQIRQGINYPDVSITSMKLLLTNRLCRIFVNEKKIFNKESILKIFDDFSTTALTSQIHQV